MLDAQTNDPYYRESCSEHNHVPADSWSNCSIWQATRVDPETGEWITDVKEVVSDAQKLVDQWYAYSSRLKTLETVYHHFVSTIYPSLPSNTPTDLNPRIIEI